MSAVFIEHVGLTLHSESREPVQRARNPRRGAPAGVLSRVSLYTRRSTSREADRLKLPDRNAFELEVAF
jgi:hypothetical protein